MVEQQNKLSQAEVVPELNPQEQFIVKLYQKTLDWLINDQRGKIAVDMNPQEIDSWEQHAGRHPGETVWLSIDLEKGVIVKTKDRDFALVMGRRLQNRYSRERTLSFQFGMLPTDSLPTKEGKNIEMIKTLVNQRMGTYGSGEFFVNDETGKVMINCWADDTRYAGGKEIRKWTQEKLLTGEGADACLDIIQRTSKNAFIR